MAGHLAGPLPDGQWSYSLNMFGDALRDLLDLLLKRFLRPLAGVLGLVVLPLNALTVGALPVN